jgi:hypothetical protein
LLPPDDSPNENVSEDEILFYLLAVMKAVHGIFYTKVSAKLVRENLKYHEEVLPACANVDSTEPERVFKKRRRMPQPTTTCTTTWVPKAPPAFTREACAHVDIDNVRRILHFMKKYCHNFYYLVAYI